MHFFHRKETALALVALASLITTITAHSWVEQLTVIDPNGTFIGAPGFSRGNGMYPSLL